MLTAQDVANYFLTLTDDECGDNLSNLKLQKLLYYAQGFHLALYGDALFPEEIKAWQHGPVVESVYHQYKQYGAGAIPIPKIPDFSIYTPEIRELLDEIYNVFGQFSAWKLRNLTHDEPPYLQTKPGEEISRECMKEYFKTQLN
jgi:uncharacterized phage-associated protein